MPHTVWNLGTLTATARVQPRQFVAGVEPAQGIVIGRSREPKPMIVLLDCWMEVRDWRTTPTNPISQSTKYSLALGKDPLNTALLLPIGTIFGQAVDAGVGDTDQPATGMAPSVNSFFKAQGTMWAVRQIAIDFEVIGTIAVSDVDIHLDWDIAFVDWFTWFVSWNNLEASPDGNLIDGERAYG